MCLNWQVWYYIDTQQHFTAIVFNMLNHFRQNFMNVWNNSVCGFYGMVTVYSLCCFGNVLRLCFALSRQKNWCYQSECSEITVGLRHANLKYSCYYLWKSYCQENSLCLNSCDHNYILSTQANSRRQSIYQPCNFALFRSCQGKSCSEMTRFSSLGSI